MLRRWRRRRESNPCTRFCRPLPGHSGTSPPMHTAGCPARIRTSVNGSKVRCPTTRRRGIASSHASRSAATATSRRRESEGKSGAEDGTRTRDPHLGKVMLYQLSHFRPLFARHDTASRNWCRGPGSNWRHLDFQSSALPTELPRRRSSLRRSQLAFAVSHRAVARIPMPPTSRNRTSGPRSAAPSGRRCSRARAPAPRSAGGCPRATSLAPRRT